jgi:hypothetical protein
VRKAFGKYWVIQAQSRFRAQVIQPRAISAMRPSCESSATCRMIRVRCKLSLAALPLLQRFPNKANAKNRLFGLVQQFHLPFVILFEIAGDTADKIAADIGQLLPSGIMIGQRDAAASRARKTSVSDAEEIERHGEKPILLSTALLKIIQSQ